MEFNKEQKIIGLKVLNDNVIWLWEKGNSAVVVDPALSQPVTEYLRANNLNLEAILQTHHHFDHIGGTKELIKEWPNIKVIASEKEKDRIPFQNLSVKDGDKVRLLNEDVQVIEVKGHTKSHIAFFFKNKVPILFIGDTLFSAGCGRIFEGTFKQKTAYEIRLSLVGSEMCIRDRVEKGQDQLQLLIYHFPISLSLIHI